MDIGKYSDNDLRKELERREKSKLAAPDRTNRSDQEIVEQIYKTVQSCLDGAVERGYWDEDNDQYIFEAAMKAFYGDDYFHWHNKRFNQ
jgi:hypothetical protein